MLITKFNRMIRNRLIWGFFAVLVSIVFVGAFSQGGCESAPQHRGNLAGQLGEQDVTQQDFHLARFFALGLRNSAGLDDEQHALLRKQTWQRLAALQTAEELGLVTTDEEIAEMIQRDPSFAIDGVFHFDRYRQIIRTQLQITEDLFEEYLRQEITLRKLASVLEAGVWTGPSELELRLANLVDTFTASYVLIPPPPLDAVPDPQDDDILAYFEEHEEQFRIPDQVQVRYVAFSISNYLPQVSVTEEDVLAYYEEYLDEFVSIDTNGVESTQLLEDVREDIEQRLRFNAARFLAQDDATTLVVQLAPDRRGHAVSFDEAAAMFSLPIFTSSWFHANQILPEIDAGNAFTMAAFNLEPDMPDLSFSDSVTGANHVYVLSILARKDNYIPELVDIQEEVIEQVRLATQVERNLQEAETKRDELQAALTKGLAFPAAVDDAGMNVSTTVTFSAYASMGGEFLYADTLVPKIITMTSGDISEPIDIGQGLALVYVHARSPADPFSLQIPRTQLLAALNNYQSDMLQQEWMKHRLKEIGFTDLSDPAGFMADIPDEDEDW